MERTNGITNLLPPAAMLPRPIPAVAVLLDVNDAPAASFDELEDLLTAQAVLLHHLRAIAFDHNISFFDQLEKFEAVRFILEVQMRCPFA